METILYDEIPSVDLNHFIYGTATEKEQFVQSISDAFKNIGFVAVRNHGLSDELTQRLYKEVRNFFELPEDLKRKYEHPELYGQRGYVSKGKEKAKGRNTGDLKEFYHVGQMPENQKSGYPDNIWPKEVNDFEPTLSEAYRILQKTGLRLLEAIALSLGIEEKYFENKAECGNSILRAIHYFPIDNPEDLPADAVRAAEHGDINLITLLMGASADGLQVKRLDGKWIPITALPDQIVVNVGDMLARLTNDVLKSTIHRVVNPPRHLMHTSRYSIPFFMHPVSEMDLSCLENCISSSNPKKYSDITAGEFLEERLREIGLKA